MSLALLVQVSAIPGAPGASDRLSLHLRTLHPELIGRTLGLGAR